MNASLDSLNLQGQGTIAKNLGYNDKTDLDERETDLA